MTNTPIVSFQEIENEWESVLRDSPENTLFLTSQWQKVWWDTFGEGHTMCGFTYPEPNEISAIASLAKSGDTVSFIGSEDTFDYNDFLIRPGHEVGFYQTLLDCMEEQKFGMLRLVSLLSLIHI